MNRKVLFFALLFVMTLFACNRKVFLNKLEGTWHLNKYLYNGQDMTVSFKDTSYINFQLTINSNNQYQETWQSNAFVPGFSVMIDTIFNPADSMYIVNHDTTYYVSSVVTTHIQNGRWDLLNSESDLQLINDSNPNSPVEYQILKLTKSDLNLLTGNSEYDLTK